jgi:hypothetical protein
MNFRWRRINSQSEKTEEFIAAFEKEILGSTYRQLGEVHTRLYEERPQAAPIQKQNRPFS